MSDSEFSDRRTARRRATKAEIIAAAWGMAREEGLAGLSMRALGSRVGMRAQSLYSYFASKLDIYDVMFLEGYREFAARMADLGTPSQIKADPSGTAREAARRFFVFCTEDEVRYQLLFQRTIPGFEPSPQSWKVATEAYAVMVEQLALLGVTDPGGVDLWTATLTGMTSQQLSNDPGGDRWERLLDRAVEMLLSATVSADPKGPMNASTRS